MPQIRLDADLSDSHKNQIMAGVLSRRSEASQSASLSFSKGCSGAGGRCDHDLSISATFS